MPALIAGVLLGTALLGTVLLAGCESEPDPTTYVARVGDMVLTDDDVSTLLGSLPSNVDTAEARQQVVEQWVTRSLLLQEAERLNLREEPTVQRRMKEQERSILVTALTDRIYAEAELSPSEAEIRNFFQSNRRQMTLREPFVRVRHLSTAAPEQADSARTALQEAATAGRSLDSTFAALIDQYAAFPDQARRLTAKFVPESRLFGHRPYVRDELTELGDGDIAPVVEDDRFFHVLQLVERIPEGAEPELAWVEDEIRRRLTIRSRKQMYAREVQRLRNQALAENDLQFGTPGATGDETGDGETVDEPAAPTEDSSDASGKDTATEDTATEDTATRDGERGRDPGRDTEAQQAAPQASPTQEPDAARDASPTEATEPEPEEPGNTAPPEPDTAPSDTAPSDTTPSDTAPSDTEPSGTESTDSVPPDEQPPNVNETDPASTEDPAMDRAPADAAPSDASDATPSDASGGDDSAASADTTGDGS
jgi:hypothetical protein